MGEGDGATVIGTIIVRFARQSIPFCAFCTIFIDMGFGFLHRTDVACHFGVRFV